MKPALSAPSATSLLAGGALLIAVGLSRCPSTRTGAATPSASPPSATAAPAPPPTTPRPSTAPTEAVPETRAENALAGTETQENVRTGTETPARKRYVVAAIGDSLTDARVGGGKFLSYLSQRCPGSRFDNFGRGGDMVNQMRKRFEHEIAGIPGYTHLLVFGGVNDLYSDLTAGRTPQKIQSDLGWMYGQAQKRGWRVIALTVAPWGGFSKYYNAKRAGSTRELNTWIQEQLSDRRVEHVVDAYSLLSCGDAERLCPEYALPFRDGLHFGPKGHEKLGEALYQSVFSDCR